MKIVKDETIIEFIEKKSKFIGYLKAVDTVLEANEYIEKIRSLHPTATHNVPCYRVIENGQEYFKYNDDGEPLNTAAKPMADIMERKELYNFAMVATRYFGGIKLGAGGLIRNYARVAKELSENCEVEEYVKKAIYLLVYDYTKQGIIDKILREQNIEILEKSFLEKINIKMKLSDYEKENFLNLKDIELINLTEERK